MARTKIGNELPCLELIGVTSFSKGGFLYITHSTSCLDPRFIHLTYHACVWIFIVFLSILVDINFHPTVVQAVETATSWVWRWALIGWTLAYSGIEKRGKTAITFIYNSQRSPSISHHIGPVIILTFAIFGEGESTAGYTFTPVWDLLLALAYPTWTNTLKQCLISIVCRASS
jgi:hypothetical protein